MRYLCPLLNFPTTTMSWNLSVLWFSFLIHSPPTVGFNTRAEEKKRMVKFAYFFSSLCPLESDPRRAAFVYHRSQLLLKVLHKQPAVSTYHYQPLHSLTIPTTPSVMGMVAVPSLSTRLLLYSFYLPCSLTTSL